VHVLVSPVFILPVALGFSSSRTQSPENEILISQDTDNSFTPKSQGFRVTSVGLHPVSSHGWKVITTLGGGFVTSKSTLLGTSPGQPGTTLQSILLITINVPLVGVGFSVGWLLSPVISKFLYAPKTQPSNQVL
jgi:hypothetical protein